jgi:hypothetical protein
MAAGDLINNDFEIEYNGVVTGDTNNIEVVRCSLFNAPAVRHKSLDRPLDQGSFSSQGFYSGRTVAVDMEVWGATEAELQTNLIAALNLTELTTNDTPWVMQLPGFGKVRLEGKCIRRDVSPIDRDYSTGYVTRITADWWMPNPRILSNSESSQVLGKAVASGGMNYDISYDISYGASGNSGNRLVNAGSYETRPRAVITGPINTPVLENVTQGKALRFNGTLTAAQTLEVDFYTRQVLLNGTASRYSWINDVTQWWALQPGDNEVRLNGTTAGSPTATFTWRSAWM